MNPMMTLIEGFEGSGKPLLHTSGSMIENPFFSRRDALRPGVHNLTVAAHTYAALIALPEGEAHRLLTIGPDDKANMEATHREHRTLEEN